MSRDEPGGQHPPEYPWTRREHGPLLLGRGGYVGDVHRDGQLSLAVVRSVEAHGTIRRIEAEDAKKVPGVHAVLTAADLPRPLYLPLRTQDHPEYLRFLEPVLADDKVRYVGQPVAVVVADSAHLAEDAAELVDVDVEPADATTSAWEPGIEPLWGGVPDNITATIHADDGNIDDVFARADVIVRADLRVGRDTGMPMETRGLVAEWFDDGRLHLWGPTKIVQFVRRTIADFFEIAHDAVVCHHVAVGGMFGPRGELYPEDFLVPWAAAVLKRPVKWVEDRHEHFLSINHSREQHHQAEVAATTDGRLLGLRADIWIDMGAYIHPVAWRVPEGTVEHLPGPYPWEAVSIRCRAACTNKTPAGTMRGPTNYETTFVRERLLDLVADRLGLDPVEVRRKNLIPAGALPYEQALGPELPPVTYDSGDFTQVFDGLLERSHLADIRADLANRRSNGELVGLGVACFLGHSGLGVDETVRLDLLPGGRFRVATSASETGQNLASMVSRMVERGLGIREVPVEVVTGDTDTHDGGRGTFSSRSTMLVGSAVLEGCHRLRQAAIDKAAALLDRSAVDLTITCNGVECPAGSVTWSDIAPLTVDGYHRMPAPTYGFGAHLAIAAIDAATAELHVERLGVAFDCGTIIDPAGANAQLEGATAQGLAGAAFAELPFDPTGQPMATSFMDYLVPTAAEVPPIEVYPFELPGTTGNPLGAKGVGEAGIIGVGAAVANAVSDALANAGAVDSLPVKPTTIANWLPAWPPPPTTPTAPSDAPHRRKRRRILIAVGGALTVFALRRLINRRGIGREHRR